MSPVLDALDQAGEFGEDEITLVEDTGKLRARRSRRPEDAEIDRITLRRPPGSAAILFDGRGALKEAQLMLDAWARGLQRGQDDAVSFEVYFGDGLVYSGIIHIRRRRDRNLARHLRREENFRAAFCPDLDSKGAANMFALFIASYRIASKVGPVPFLSECAA